MPQYHSNVAKGPDGSRGFAVRRTRLSYPAMGVSLPYIFRSLLAEPAYLTSARGTTAGHAQAVAAEHALVEIKPELPDVAPGAAACGDPSRDVWEDGDDDIEENVPAQSDTDVADDWENDFVDSSTPDTPCDGAAGARGGSVYGDLTAEHGARSSGQRSREGARIPLFGVLKTILKSHATLPCHSLLESQR